jgi:formate C-acetyltransferase
MVQGGNTSLVFCHDEMIVKCLMARGTTYESGLDSVISGCYEYKSKNGGVGISGFHVNLLKPISYVFDNGFDRFTNLQIGVETGDVANLETFDDFYNAYLRQLEHITLSYMDALRPFEGTMYGINPALMFSPTIKACAETMTDAYDNAIDNTSTLLVSGLATAVDALMAVQELVFEKKVVSLLALRDALEKDWVGYELLQRKALNVQHKYGRGDARADHYAAAIVRFMSNLISGRKNGHDNPYLFELHSARAFIIQGDKTLATPDGRKGGEELSKNASPHPGMDRNGITDLIHSATTIDTTLANVGFCLDVMLHPTTVQGEKGVDVLYQVMRTYMDKGGQSIHFNVFNADTLRDAQEHPEKYENLQVRVCGWNTLWNTMSKTEQDAYILRAENITQ